jgi:hypothetical protein
MVKAIDLIVDSINENYVYPCFTCILQENDRSVVKNFNEFANNVFSKLDAEFEIFKLGNDFVIFKRDGVYVLLEYQFISFSGIDYEINMFGSVEDLEMYQFS